MTPSIFSFSTSSDGGGVCFEMAADTFSNRCRSTLDIASARIRNDSNRLITSTYGISQDVSSSWL